MYDFTCALRLPAPPETVFAAFVTAEGQAAFTGAATTSDPREGGAFTAWDGYITGVWRRLVAGVAIEMDWRTAEFPSDHAPARVEIALQAVEGGTQLTLRQAGSPAGQAERYAQGWEEFYFAPMRVAFGA